MVGPVGVAGLGLGLVFADSVVVRLRVEGLAGTGLRIGGLLGEEVLLTMTTTQTITTTMIMTKAAIPTIKNIRKKNGPGKPVVGVVPEVESSHQRS